MNNASTIFPALGGYIVDIKKKLSNEIFVPHSLTKLQNIDMCRRITGATTAIEIGTFRGVTARRLAKRFDKVVTVEIDEALHAEAVEKSKKFENIEFILGDGEKVLNDIAARVDNALLFLDGHFSGGQTGMGAEPEPLLAELQIISQYLTNFRSVVIDDFRLFGIEPGWPSKSQVFKQIETTFRGVEWTASVLNDQIIINRNSD